MAIVIPIYKMAPSQNELLALQQVLSVCKGRSFRLVHPQGLDLRAYKEVTDGTQEHIRYIDFTRKYFESIDGYNRLLMSKAFYQSFLDHSHICIYQLDAWIFRDELDEWASNGYDNVGAPWFEGFSDPVKPYKIIGAGNGGCCLRRVESCLRIVTTWKYQKNPLFVWKSNFTVKGLINSFLSGNNFHYKCNDTDLYEDRFFAVLVPSRFRWFNNCPPDIARKFAFDANPQYLYELNGRQLPMCCHAWERYDQSFWKAFIP